jgi:endonuclease YncB( thermonuclease family)
LQPWAWQSREFLREKLIGKVVIFRVEYTLDNGKRVGELWINDEDIRNTVVKNGWAAVPPRKDKEGNDRPVSKEDQVLVNCMSSFGFGFFLFPVQEEAKTKKVGIYRTPDAKSIRKVTYHDFSDQKKEATFFEKNKSSKRTGIWI